MDNSDNSLKKVGVFYDGNYFAHVSNYYCYHHQRRKRISVSGLHDFIRYKVAQEESTDIRLCQIVDSHYFRGRLSAVEAQNKNTLFNERQFDQILMNEGVVTHYLPLGPSGEKGIDVWLALEVFELAIFKRFNVVVLVACDGDYVPLARKLNTLGIRVMVLGWDFEITAQDGQTRKTVTSQKLLNEVTYPVMMNSIIDDKINFKDSVVNNLFVAPFEAKVLPPKALAISTELQDGVPRQGKIKALKDGYGFISMLDGGPDCFFYWGDIDFDFNELEVGMTVEFYIEANEKGLVAKSISLVAGAVPNGNI